MNINFLPVLMIFSIVFFGCPSDQDPQNNYVCPSEFDWGEVMLIDSSLAVYPYKENDSKVVFIDQSGYEIAFEIKELSTKITNDSHTGKCGSNPDQEVTYFYQLFYRYAELINDSLDIRIKVIMIPEISSLLTSPDQGNDMLYLYLNKPLDSFDKEMLRLWINRRNNNEGIGILPASPPCDSLISINNIEFEKVFNGQAESFNEEIKVHCNRHQGIVGIQNLTSGLILAFDRIE